MFTFTETEVKIVRTFIQHENPICNLINLTDIEQYAIDCVDNPYEVSASIAAKLAYLGLFEFSIGDVVRFMKNGEWSEPSEIIGTDIIGDKLFFSVKNSGCVQNVCVEDLSLFKPAVQF